MWFTNLNLPDDGDMRAARNHLNPDKCVLDGYYIMPSPYNDKNYIGSHSTVMGRRGEIRDLHSFELVPLKGLPMGYTQTEVLNADRNQMNKLMNDINMPIGFDRSDTGRIEKYATEDQTAGALHNCVAATISTSLNYRELFGRNKKLQRDNLDEIINNISASMAEFYMDKFYLKGINTSRQDHC